MSRKGLFTSKLTASVLVKGETVQWMTSKSKNFPYKAKAGEGLTADTPKHPGHVTLILPRQEVLVKTLQLPSTDNEELQRLVPFKLHQELPYTTEEIIYHYEKGGMTKEGYTDIHVYWTLQKKLKETLKPLAPFHWELDVITTSSYAILNYYQAVRQKDKALPDHVLIVDISKENSELVLIKKNALLSSRLIKKGAIHLKNDAEDYLQALQNALSNFEKPEALFRTASVESQEKLDAFFSEKFAMPLDSLPAPSMGPKTSASIPIWLAGGLPIKSLKQQDFSSSEILEKRQIKTNQAYHKQSFLGILSFLALSLMALYLCLLTKETQLQKLVEKSRALSPKAKQVIQTAEKLYDLQTFNTDKKTPIDLLASLHTLTPPNIFLTSLEYDLHEGFKIRGLGENNDTIGKFLRTLKARPYIDSIDFDHSKRSSHRGKDYFEFQISGFFDQETMERPGSQW